MAKRKTSEPVVEVQFYNMVILRDLDPPSYYLIPSEDMTEEEQDLFEYASELSDPRNPAFIWAGHVIFPEDGPATKSEKTRRGADGDVTIITERRKGVEHHYPKTLKESEENWARFEKAVEVIKAKFKPFRQRIINRVENVLIQRFYSWQPYY